MRQNYIRELSKVIHLKEKGVVASSQRFYHLTKLMDSIHDVSLLADLPPQPTAAASSSPRLYCLCTARSWRRSTCSAWAPSSRPTPWRWSSQRWCRRSLPPSFLRFWLAWWGPCCSTQSDPTVPAPRLDYRLQNTGLFTFVKPFSQSETEIIMFLKGILSEKYYITPEVLINKVSSVINRVHLIGTIYIYVFSDESTSIL